MANVVAIVGAGPAGCAAALTLRRYLPELTVVLVTLPAAAVAPAVGETLSPGAFTAARLPRNPGRLSGAGHLPAGGTASAWGSDRSSSAAIFSRVEGPAGTWTGSFRCLAPGSRRGRGCSIDPRSRHSEHENGRPLVA